MLCLFNAHHALILITLVPISADPFNYGKQFCLSLSSASVILMQGKVTLLMVLRCLFK